MFPEYIMTNMVNDLAERMVILMRVVNISGLSGNKLSHELNGMVMAVKAIGIDYEFEFNSDVTQYTALILNGNRYEV